MEDYIPPFIAVIVTLLVVGILGYIIVNAWWSRGKLWFSGFKDIHLTRTDQGEVKLEATVRDQGKAPVAIAKEDVRR